MLPVYRPPLNMTALFGEAPIGEQNELGVSVRYLTPHNKWSIHSEYQDNLFMLSLSRGGQSVWISDRDAAKVGITDNDWIEMVNRNGVVAARAIVSHRMPRARSTCTTPRTGSSTCPSPSATASAAASTTA